MHLIENEKVKIVLNLPNYPQSMRLIAELGLSKSDSYDYFEMLALISERGEQFIDEISVKGEKLSYDDFLNNPNFSKEINEIVTLISGRIEEFSTGKKKG
jgi:hypothetical protein